MQESNFGFLKKDYQILFQVGSMAEKQLYIDPNTCLMKLGQFGELVVKQIFRLERLTLSGVEHTHANRIRLLNQQGRLPRIISDILFELRTTRNNATHTGYDSSEDCKTLLQMAYNLGVWFMRTYGDFSFQKKEFTLPKPETPDTAFQQQLKEKEEEIKKLTEQLAKLTEQQAAASIEQTPDQEEKKQRLKLSQEAAEQINLSEAETRLIIDSQLRKVGWQADSGHIRYSKGSRPQKGVNQAIAEWPTNSKLGKAGYADYALFVGLQLVGIVEAKRSIKDIPSVIDYQCTDYSKSIKEEHAHYQISTWGEHKVPFLFATNGRKYFKQIETKSGIWFLDTREKSNIPKALQGWISPNGLMELLEKDIEAANRKLQAMPYDLLLDKDGLNLRDYQIKAIQAAEKAVIAGSKNVLLSMATGTGKTRTILGMIYRFAKMERFRRILFLVDRTALGEQAQDVFSEVKIEDLQPLTRIYTIKKLDDREIDPETRIHVCTVQSMVKRILYNEEESIPSVTDYDLIVVDEAHRGYILDKEMDDDEMLYRDQNDYVSKYRTVIEYFDAVKVALTATPALHTTQIFGKPVYEYSYKEAVIDGYLVDHDLPHRIKTQLSIEGINYKKGDIPVLYDPVTQEILNSAELEDELNFDVEQFNRRVITEPFNQSVLEEIARDLDPEGDEKTLIYAVDDQHADLIVKLLKQIYEPQAVDNDAILKITGSIGPKKRILEAIKRFKNEKYPNIVVTVDLLTTGIDVPEITTLVFLRRIRSRILFEQMLGRATRLCPKIQKDHFDIYDPVGVYESLQDVSNMKPIAANPETTIDDLLAGLKEAQEERFIQKQIDLILAKMQRKMKHLPTGLSAHFEDLSEGYTPAQLIKELRSGSITERKQLLLTHEEAIRLFNPGSYRVRYKIVDETPDFIREHSRGYGEAEKPEDYLEEFTRFVNNNINTIAALNILCTRPTEFTRKTLKSLRLELDRQGFTEKRLNTAWKEVKNEEIAADIITLVRRHAIGSTLLSHEERIKNAISKLMKSHSFSKMEESWLKRIETYLLHENILEKESFETGAFKNNGGFHKINKIFNNNLEEVMRELNEYLYDDGGHVA